MEGPTPVSALIHAATLVTAGVFLLIRCSALFENSPKTLFVVTLVGALTSFLASTVGLVQNDLKRVIAYSTCSQLGYMVFSAGLSYYSIALFHLANHALFKALLFLSAGCIIHGFSDEQDMRKMGGILQLFPVSYVMVLIGSLALVGFPFLTGFYSKDAILEVAFAKSNLIGNFAYFLGCCSVFCTSFYSFRLLWLTFINRTNGFKTYVENSHEAPFKMILPLMLLALGSIF
jgi:NADH-ubiquinone oxidoreductase chain 5